MNRKDFIKSLFGVPALILATPITFHKDNLLSKPMPMKLDIKGNLNIGLGTAYPKHWLGPNYFIK